MSTQQPPARPWFRLASMAPRTAPAPAPAPAQTPQPDPVPQPRTAFIRPAVRTTSLPAQPEEPAPAPAPAPAPPAVAPAPVAIAPMPLAFVAPVSTTVALAPAPPIPRSPPTTAVVSATPRSSPVTAVAPAPAPSRTPPPPTPPSPAAPKLPTKTSSSPVLTSPIIRTSSPSLFPSSPVPKASPTPTVVQQSPKPKVSPPSSPLQNSLLATKTVSPAPAPNQITSTAAGTIAGPATNSAYSPKPVNPHPNTPSPSPKVRPIVRPPSPLTLPPPAQIKSDDEGECKNIPHEVEQKTVLVQETKEKPKMSPKNSNNNHLPRYLSEPHNTSNPHNGKREASKNGHSKNKGNHKKSQDSEDFGMRVLTLAGENKGAIMEVSPSMKKYDQFGNNPQSLGAYRTWGEGEKAASDSSSSNEEGNSESKDKSLRAIAKASPPMTAFLNSNVQCVNNSILYNVTCTHHDPGIHLSLPRKPNGGGRGSGFR